MALEKYRGEHRLLLVLAPDEDNAAYRRQQEMLRAAELGLSERDMVTVFIVQDALSMGGGLAPTGSAGDLRNAYDVMPQACRVALIGKDGSMKLHEEEPIAAADLFALIDALPMRKREMRER
jgi:hypothetical protein